LETTEQIIGGVGVRVEVAVGVIGVGVSDGKGVSEGRGVSDGVKVAVTRGVSVKNGGNIVIVGGTTVGGWLASLLLKSHAARIMHNPNTHSERRFIFLTTVH
jgi:hypothetical protein